MTSPAKSCLVVMQPTVLPWAGYFNLIAQADDFVFLDDVQLERQSWQTRNRILIEKKAKWICIPLCHKNLGQTIKETKVIEGGNWRLKLARSVEMNYGRHPYFQDAYEIIEWLISSPEDTLAALNEELIRKIVSQLDLRPRMHTASKTGIVGQRSERLIKLCQHFNARDYLSPIGSAAYLEEDGFLPRSPAILRFQRYEPQPYSQYGMQAFTSHLSIVDVVANLGWDGARHYVIFGEQT